MTKPKPKCPDCGKLYATDKLVAMHRARAHGYVGMSKSSIAGRALRAKKKAEALKLPTATPILEVQPETIPPAALSNSFVCPECNEPQKNKVELGKHRRFQHNIRGTSKDALAARREKQIGATGGLPCPHCEFIAVNKAGYSLHVNKWHRDEDKGASLERTAQQPTRALSTSRAIGNGNGHAIEQRQVDPDAIPEATLALALGRFQGLCTSMATEFDLPPRRFARELSRLVYATQVR